MSAQLRHPTVHAARDLRGFFASLALGAVLIAAAAHPAQAQGATKGPRGDVTLDGTVSAADAQAILFAVVGLPLPPDHAPLPWGDVNGDGKVGALDAQVVLNYVVGLPTTGFTVGQLIPRVRAVDLTPGTAALLAGNTQQLVVGAKDSAGAPLADRPVRWISSDTTILKISETGLVTALKDGYASVSAYSEGVSSTTYVGVGPFTDLACTGYQGPGTPHGGTVKVNQVWTRAASPHIVGSDVQVDSGAVLTVEPGAGVCVAPGVKLSFTNGARLSARGSTSLPISFSAKTPGQGWAGLVFDGAPSDFSYLGRVVVSDAGSATTGATPAALVSLASHKVQLDTVRVARSGSGALDLGAAGSMLHRVVVDTTMNAAYPGIRARAAVTLDSVTMRKAAGIGLSIEGSGVKLTDVTVKDAGGVGIVGASSAALASALRVVVNGAGGYPMEGPVQLLASIAPSPTEQAGLLGNAKDTVRVLGGLLRGQSLGLDKALPLRIENGFNVDSGAVIRMRTGARMAFGDTIGITFNPGGRLDAQGTSTDSLVFTAIDSTKNWGPILFENDKAGDTSFVRFARVEFGGVKLAVPNQRGNGDPAFEQDVGTVIMENVFARKYQAIAFALFTGGTLRNAVVDSGLVNIGFGAVLAGGGATLDNVAVRRASNAGFQLGPQAGTQMTLRGTLSVDGSGPGIAAVHVSAASRVGMASVSNTATISVKNARGYPLRTTIGLLNAFAKDSATQAGFLGNGNLSDTILVAGGTLLRDTVTAYGGMTWRISGSLTADSGSVLALRPGVRMTVDSARFISFNRGGRLIARGSATAPLSVGNFSSNPAAKWGGFTFTDTPGDSSYLTNAVIEGAQGFATINGTTSNTNTGQQTATHAVVLDSVTVRQSKYRGVYLASAGSRFSRSRVDTTTAALDDKNGNAVPGAVQLSAATAFDGSTVRGAAATGMIVTGTSVRINGGAVTGSAGNGINFTSGVTFTQYVAPAVSGGLAYPIVASITSLSRVARDSAMQAAYRGNARDTIVIAGGSFARDTIRLTSAIPWRVSFGVTVDTSSLLAIEPGAHIAVADSQTIFFLNGGRLDARGTASRPILLGPANPSGVMGDISFNGAPVDSSRLQHVVISRGGHFSAAVISTGSHAVVMDSVEIRSARQRALSLNATGSRFTNSLADSTLFATDRLGNAVIASVFLAGTGTALQGSTIRFSKVAGLQVVGTNNSVVGGSVVNNAGVGIVFSTSTLGAYQAPVITGNGSYPFSANLSILSRVAKDSVAQFGYVGNARDTIVVSGGTLKRDTVHVTAAMPWRMNGITVDSSAMLVVHPGSRITLLDSVGLSFINGGRLDARGTVSRPIQLSSTTSSTFFGDLFFSGTPADSSYLRNVTLLRGGWYGAAVSSSGSHPVVMDSVTIRQSRHRAVNVFSPGSRLTRSTVDSTIFPQDRLGNPIVAAVTIGSSANKVEGSTITGSAVAGLQAGGTAPSVIGGAILRSKGAGIVFSSSTVGQWTAPVISGGASYPFTAPISFLPRIAPDSATQAGFVGNARDTIVLTSSSVKHDTVHFTSAIPFRFAGSIFADSGSLVVMHPGTHIVVADSQPISFSHGSRLDARGTATRPIVLSSANPTGWFGDINLNDVPTDSSYLKNMLIERAGYRLAAVAVTAGHPVVIDSVHFRQSKYRAVNANGDIRISRSIVDSTSGTVDYFGNQNPGAIALGGTSGTVEQTVIRGAASAGMQLFGQNLIITGDSILGSASTGIVFGNSKAVSQFSGNVVRGGASYPISAPLALLPKVARDSITQAGFVGNARDTLVINGGSVVRDTIRLTGAIAWRANFGFTMDTLSLLVMQPGTHLVMADSQSLGFINHARLDARGTTGAGRILITSRSPSVHFGDVYFSLASPADTSYLSYATIDHGGGSFAAVQAIANHVLLMDSVVIRQAKYRAAYLTTAGTRFTNSLVDTTLSTRDKGNYPIMAAVFADIPGGSVTSTTIRGSRTAGLEVAGGNTSVVGGAIVGSDSAGIVFSTGSIGTWSSPSITGGHSYPLRVSYSLLPRIAPDSATQASFVGNAKDTIVVTGGTVSSDTVRLTSAIPWRFDGFPQTTGTAVMRVYPGTHIAMADSLGMGFSGGGRLISQGTATRPITFTSFDNTRTFGDLSFNDAPSLPSYLSNTILVRGGYYTAAVGAFSGQHVVVMDSMRFVNSHHRAVFLSANGTSLRRSVINGTQSATDRLGNSRMAAIMAQSDNTIIEADSVIGSKGVGVYLANSGATLKGTAIIGSADAGLRIAQYATPYAFDSVRVTGGLSYPLETSLDQLLIVAQDTASQRAYIGNVNGDTVNVVGGTLTGGSALQFSPLLAWRIQDAITVDNFSTLNVLPGTHISLRADQGMTFSNSGHLRAFGTQQDSIVFRSLGAAPFGDLSFDGNSNDFISFITHARIENGGSAYAAVKSFNAHLVSLDSVHIVRSRYRAAYLGAIGSSITNSVIDTTVSPLDGTSNPYGAVELRALSTSISGTRIRNAGSTGLIAAGVNATVAADSILGSGGIGLDVSIGSMASFTSPIIRGGHSYAVAGSPSNVAIVAADSAMQARYTGNVAGDTLLVLGGVLTGDILDIGNPLVWRFNGAVGLHGGMSVSQGAHLAFAEGQFLEVYDSTLNVKGTAAAPVVFTRATPGTYWGGLRFYSANGGTSSISNAIVEYAGDLAISAAIDNHFTTLHPLYVDSTIVRFSNGNGVRLGYNSSMYVSSIEDAAWDALSVAGNYAYTYGVHALRAGQSGFVVENGTSGLTLSYSEAINSGSAGLLIQNGGGQSIHHLNLLGSVGYDAQDSNGDSYQDVTDTWWGTTGSPRVSAQIGTTNQAGSPVVIPTTVPTF